jgi:hypothetical protein
MLELDKHLESAKTCKTPQEPFIRKPFKKDKNPKLVNFEKIPEILNFRSSRFSEFKSISTPTPKTRLTIDSKISNLLDFGIVPEMPLSCRDLLRLKQEKNQRIKISDFLSKNTKKQIISFHGSDLQDSSNEKFLFESKRKIFPAFSFTALNNFESDSVRISRTNQTLPPIQSNDLEKSPRFKNFELREEKLKKLEKIVDDCEFALREGKKNLKKLGGQCFYLKSEGKLEFDSQFKY